MWKHVFCNFYFFILLTASFGEKCLSQVSKNSFSFLAFLWKTCCKKNNNNTNPKRFKLIFVCVSCEIRPSVLWQVWLGLADCDRLVVKVPQSRIAQVCFSSKWALNLWILSFNCAFLSPPLQHVNKMLTKSVRETHRVCFSLCPSSCRPFWRGCHCFLQFEQTQQPKMGSCVDFGDGVQCSYFTANASRSMKWPGAKASHKRIPLWCGLPFSSSRGDLFTGRWTHGSSVRHLRCDGPGFSPVPPARSTQLQHQ